MSDNPLDTSPKRDALIQKRAKALMAAEGGVGSLADYMEKADELVRIELAGPTGQKGIDEPEFVEEAAIQENLGEFPGARSFADQGEWRETPMTRDELDHKTEK